jgi:hypothetical protein
MIRPFVVFLMVLVAWPTLAAARPTRVVIAQISGDDGGDVSTALRASISSDVQIVGKREVSKVSDKLKLSEELTDKEVRKLIKGVDADAVIKGTLDKSGDTQALHLKVYLKTEVKPHAFTLSFSNSASDKFRATLRKTILSKLGVEGGDSGGDDSDATPPKRKKHPAADDSGDDSGGDDATPPKRKKHPAADDSGDDSGGDDAAPVKPKKKKKKPAGDDSGDGGDDDSGDDATPVVVSNGHAANRDAVRVDFGASVTGRSLTFASRSFAQAPKPYKNGEVPGLRVEGEVYPIAFASPRSIASGLGFGFLYDKTLSLTLRSTASDGTPIAAKANEARYNFGPRVRIVFGQKPTSPSLTLEADYGLRQFVVDRSGLTMPTDIDIPDIQYKGYLPGFALRIPFAPAVALTLDARAFLVTSAGPIQALSSYGQAKVTGGQASAGIDIVIGNRVAIKLVGEYAQFGFAFVGNGTEAVNRDGDASSVDVGGAADRYIGAAATLAVMY